MASDRPNTVVVRELEKYFVVKDHNSVSNPTVSLKPTTVHVQLGPKVTPFHVDDAGGSCQSQASLPAIKVWFLASRPMFESVDAFRNVTRQSSGLRTEDLIRAFEYGAVVAILRVRKL